MIKKILELDVEISQRFLLSESKVILRKLASFIAHSGDSWYIEIVLFLIWVFSSGKTHTIAAYFAGSVIIQALLVIAIKFLIKRRRPEGKWGEVYRNADPHSFPSGHAARMIMLSVLAFGFSLSAMGWIVLIWGLTVSFARVSLGVHYLADIIVGWLIGIFLAEMMLSLQSFFFQLFPFVF